jgi:hypothetical protein
MTRSARARPQTAFHARISSPENTPSIRGLENASSMTPSNSPYPPIGIAPVFEPKAVMMPASTRLLSCQSRLVTWKGIRERSP